MSDFATPLFHLCLQKRREEVQDGTLAAHELRQVPQPTRTLIIGERLDGLRDRLAEQAKLDARHEG